MRLRMLLAVGVSVLSAAVHGSEGTAEPGRTAAPQVAPDVPATSVDLRLGRARNSPMLAADPTDARFVVLADRLDAPTYGCDLEISSDGGRSWTGENPVPKLPPGAEECYGPEVAFDGSGRLYFLFVGLHTAGHLPMGVFLTTSTDRGRSFSSPRRLLGANAFSVRMAIDTQPGGHGRLHLVWLQATSEPSSGSLPAGDNPVLAAHSDDRGKTLSAPVRVSDPQRRHAVAPSVAIGPGHHVDVAYYDLGDDVRDYQGLEGPRWDGTWSVLLAASQDAGMTFGAGSVVDDGIVPQERVMLIFTMPGPALAVTRSGIVVGWSDARSGHAQILSRRSPDIGHSWGPIVTASGPGAPADSDFFLPRMSSTPAGRIDAVFYGTHQGADRRLRDVYYSASTDGGGSFASGVRVNRESSDPVIGARYAGPAAVGLVEPGSRLGLVSIGDHAVAAWSDTRNARRLPDEFPGKTDQDVYVTEVHPA